METLHIRPLRNLEVDRPGPAGHKHLSAGSGITKAGHTLHVIADDSLDLGVFDERAPQEPGRLHPLLVRPALPLEEKARKKVKPDLEGGTKLVKDGKAYLLAVGSGSTDQRKTGVCVPLDADGQPEKTIEFDVTPLYDHLKKQFPELNVEGIAQMETLGLLRLAQRGNGTPVENAVADLDLERAFAAAREGRSWGPELLLAVQHVRLPEMDGVPLTLTDLCPLDGTQLLFSCAGEKTDNPYDDGQIVGSAIGVMHPDGSVTNLKRVDQPVKIEGIYAEENRLWLVTDGDHPESPATLFEALR